MANSSQGAESVPDDPVRRAALEAARVRIEDELAKLQNNPDAAARALVLSAKLLVLQAAALTTQFSSLGACPKDGTHMYVVVTTDGVVLQCGWNPYHEFPL